MYIYQILTKKVLPEFRLFTGIQISDLPEFKFTGIQFTGIHRNSPEFTGIHEFLFVR